MWFDRRWLSLIVIGAFMLGLVPVVFAASGLLDREERRLQQARDGHEREVERARERFESQVERANQQLERHYEQIIRALESRGEQAAADRLRRELKDLLERAFTEVPGGSSKSSSEEDEDDASEERSEPEEERRDRTREHGHKDLIEAVGPVLYRIDGTEVDSRTLAEREYVLLYFSAQWCAPCRTFTPELIDFYRNAGGGQRFEIILVSRDRSQQEMVEYARESRMPWTVMEYDRVDQSGLMQTFNVRGIPRLVVLNGRGREAVKGDGARDVLRKFGQRLER